MKEAVKAGAKSVAFPAISTGVYRFPPDLAAEIAVKTVLSFLKDDSHIGEVRVVCFSDESVLHHERALERYRRDNFS